MMEGSEHTCITLTALQVAAAFAKYALKMPWVGFNRFGYQDEIKRICFCALNSCTEIENTKLKRHVAFRCE